MLAKDVEDLDNFIDNYEAEMEKRNENIDKVDIDIDCNSKFMKITGLVLLAFLL